MTLDSWLKKAKRNGIIVKEEKKMEVKKPGSSPIKKVVLPESSREKLGHRNPKGTIQHQFIEQFPEVKEWLKRKPKGTTKIYSFHLLKFCRETNMTPKQFGELSHNKAEMEKARDIAWDIICKTKDRASGRYAKGMRNALQSFYRFYTKGYKLPFDSQKGGHHTIREEFKEKREKFQWGTLE